VLDPDEIDRRRVCEMVSLTAEMQLVGHAPWLCAEVLTSRPDFILICSNLVTANLKELRSLTRELPSLRFVFFDRKPSINTFLDALSLPVCGLLSLNHLSGQEFVRSLTTISLGGAVIEPIAAQELIEHLRELPTGVLSEAAGLSPLSQRENEVLAYVSNGMANKEIASRLHISLGTVRAHLRSIFRKLDVSSRTAAANFNRHLGGIAARGSS
jgi:DNA-binding NarL/FixJ family response regulator